MPRPWKIPALGSLALVASLLSPASAPASPFAQSWEVSGWDWAGDLGNSDADIQPEMLFLHAGDGHYAVFDQLHGTLEKEFATFSPSNSTLGAGDIDGDGRSDLVVRSHPFVVPPFFHAYRWNGSDYVPFFAHADSVAHYGMTTFRFASQPEFWELSADPMMPECDFRLRTLAGSVLFRAATNVPGWTGPFRSSTWVDRNGDGVTELLLEDQASVRMFNQYAGSFTVAWTLPGWYSAIEVGNLDSDPQSEFLVLNIADDHYGIVDGTSGALQQEFPAFALPESFLSIQDVDNDGRGEVIAQKFVSGQPTVFSIHRWNGATLAQLVSVTATHEFSNLTLVGLRNSTQVDIFELSPTDALLRDLSGALLFQASTAIPGWSVVPFSFGFQIADPDQDGDPDMILHDLSHVWAIRYDGAFNLLWAANGWRYVQELGNLDGDPQGEFMLTNSVDSRFALFDGLAGTSQQDFPLFASNTSSFIPLDSDDDGKSELYFGRMPGETPLFTAYAWNGSTHAPTYSHTEPVGQWSPVQLRSDSQFEFLEVDNTDIRVRDLTATVLFRASTDLPDWPGLPSAFASRANNFPEMFGPRALFIVDPEKTRFVLHHGPVGVPATPGAGALRVFPNAPNPFRTTTAFRLSNPKAGEVGIRVFDAAGRLVRRLDRHLAAGEHEVRWDGRDDAGRDVPSGVLFYEVTAEGHRQTRKLIRTQ